MLIIYKKVGGILKKVISIVLALCLSGCAVLDAFTGNKNNHSMNSTQDNTETTVDSKNEIGTVNQANIDPKFYLYYYEQLTQTQKEAYLDLYQALQNQSAIYELKTPTSIKDFNIAFYAFEYDFPEAFWMWNYRYLSNGEDKITRLQFNVPADLSTTMAQVNQVVDKVVNDVKGASDYEKIKYFYEWIINWTVYQRNQCEQDITGVFLLRQSVCGGYSKAFQYLCKKAGIKCTYVLGMTDQLHAWNLVELDGKYYWVDATWGDSFDSEGNTVLNYHYFMVPDEILFRTHLSLNGKVPVGTLNEIDVFKFPKCTDNSLSYYAQNGAYFETYDYDAIKKYILKKIKEDPYQYIEFQIGDIKSYKQALQLLFTQESNQIYSILKDYFGSDYKLDYYQVDEVGVIGIQVYQ